MPLGSREPFWLTLALNASVTTSGLNGASFVWSQDLDRTVAESCKRRDRPWTMLISIGLGRLDQHDVDDDDDDDDEDDDEHEHEDEA